MLGINQYGTTLYGNYSNALNLNILVNYRYKILEALKNNLLAITAANLFQISIANVYFGDDSTTVQDKEACIYGVRDIAVVEFTGTTINRNSALIRSQTKLRNLYVLFKVRYKPVKSQPVTNYAVSARETFIDEIIKGLYGYNDNGRQLKDLMTLGVNNDFGLVAYEVSKVDSYALKDDLTLKFEALFQYKLKYY